MNGKKRVGIFGGTFNPPHIGHVEAAKSFISSLRVRNSEVNTDGEILTDILYIIYFIIL